MLQKETLPENTTEESNEVLATFRQPTGSRERPSVANERLMGGVWGGGEEVYSSLHQGYCRANLDLFAQEA